MSDLQVTGVIFLVFAVPGTLLCLTAIAGEAIASRINRRQS